jgi:chemotaxis protein histidine kinase CheA
MLEADFQSNSEEGVRKHTMRLPAFSETVGDLSEIGRALRETFEPMGEENQAITRFIRQFRQELVNLVRTPMSGLFRRLQRAIADAARVEGKRVRVEIIDADVGLERSVQERLLDPLLHIVRNSVGHGIETEEERRRAGKDPVGRITIETQGKPNLLVLTISDDGRGLDYDALRRRGLELGLLRGDRDASPQELAQLIFHAGFSTRKTANSVAGRGVGMDIVATTLDQMRSWVEVDSRPGDGTRVRITVPLRSIIDHAMVVRAAGQLFALPIPFVRTASPAADGDTRAVPLPAYPLQQLLGRPVPPLTSQSELIVDIKPFVNTETLDAAAGDKQEAASFTVDEIIGPEEVVIRPLPPLLRHQSLFTGITLSGDGELVLVMDPRRLVEFATGQVRAKTPCVPAEEPQTHILVVDDSLSSRRSVSFALRRHNLRGLEVADGAAALEAFARHDIRAVITDYEMPGMDGLVLLQRLRERLGPRFPLVMMTSCRLESVKAQAEALGVLRFLRKPLVPEELDQAIVRIHQEMGATNRL